MNGQKYEPRYRKLIRDFKSTRLYKYWNSSVSKGTALWGYSKNIMWGVTVGAILFLLPLALQITLEGEAQVEMLNTQLKGDINPNVEYRSY